jgi:hypothetical protein
MSISEYAQMLMIELMEKYQDDSTALKRCIDDINVPRPLAHEFERPDKEEIINSFIGRFQ